MIVYRALTRVTLFAALPALLLAAAACGNDNTEETSTTSTPTAASATATQPSPTTAPTIAGARVSPSASAQAGAQALQQVATDNKFSASSLTATAGAPIALTLTNAGSAIHNWHLLDAKDASGRDIATQLLQPGTSETITFQIATPGTYHFQCDVHPQDMKGTLTVK